MKKEKQKRNGKVGKAVKTILSTVATLFLVVLLIAANTVLPTYARMIDCMLGYKQSVNNKNADTEGVDLDYYKADYTNDTIKEAETALNEQIVGEGVVLLQNEENTMPYAKNTKFSFFSASSTAFTGGTMMSVTQNLKDSFEEAGFGVNEELWDFYSKGNGKDYGLGKGSISFGDAEDYTINECPLSVMQSEEGLLDSCKDTTPVFVMRRVGGEGRDVPRSMYNHTDIEEDQEKNYLEPDSNELAILQYLNDNYSDVVLLLNMNYAMELDWVKDFPNIHAVVSIPSVGEHGMTSVAGVFSGDINPSGKLVDTYAADVLASPAAQNFGDYAYYTEDGKLTKYNYVSYKEGIYVGYKYYETRYEDKVLGQGNAGEFDYNKEVCYPFGYGLSYTDFAWSDFNVNWDGDTCSASVNVTNTGDVAGKDVVQIYAQKPYSEYDQANGIETASVELVGYGKTGEIAPGENETVTITFDKEQLKSYDANNAKTYILDAGDYYITAGKDAHDAVNNILTAKGKTTADGMTADGNAAFVNVYTPDLNEVDTTTYSLDTATGTPITNQFDAVSEGLGTMSRSDWEGTFPQHDGEASDVISTWGNEINGTDENGNPASYTYKKTIANEDLAKLDSADSNSPVDKDTLKDEIVFGADNGLKLIDMRGLSYDDPKWDDLLDELTVEDYQNTITLSGYGTAELDSIDKPFCVDADTASGLLYGGTGANYQGSIVLAQTWNQDLAQEYGTMLGNEALLGGCAGWYAPSMNIHRTPFSGRNGEYYSEDGFLSGAVASRSIEGAATKGMYAYIKHFALNDQEDHRGDRDGQFGAATFANEQSIREIYLRPFEMCMKTGTITENYVTKDDNGKYVNAKTEVPVCQAVMTAFNRIGYTWTGGDYALLTGVLRNEWGFNGFVLTDNANTGVFMDGYQMIEAGGDAKLTYLPDSARYDFDESSVADYHYGRNAMHHLLYTIANSKAMNGAMPGSSFEEGLQVSSLIRILVNIISPILIVLLIFFTVKRFRGSKNKVSIQ